MSLALVVVSALWVGGALSSALVADRRDRLDTALTILLWPVLFFGSVLAALAERGWVWGRRATVGHVAKRASAWNWQTLCGTRRWHVALIWEPKETGNDDA